MTTRQRPWALMMAVVSVLLLSMPSAVAVFQWLEPIRGPIPAGAAAVGFELTYLSLACLLFVTTELQQSARRLQLWAVFTAVCLNSIESYSRRQGVDLSTGYAAWSTFDPWLLVLSIGESIPLAGLAFGVSMVLHRLVADDLVNPVDPPRRLQLEKWLERVAEWLPGQPQKLASSPNVLDSTTTPALPVEALSEPPMTSSDEIALSSVDQAIQDDYAEWMNAPAGPFPTDLGPLQTLLATYHRATDPKARRAIRRELREKFNYRLSDAAAVPQN